MTAARVLCGAVPFDGVRFRPGHGVVVAGGRIVALTPDPPADLPRLRLGGGILAPGFVDVQVNGGGGVMLNDAPDPATMARIAAGSVVLADVPGCKTVAGVPARIVSEAGCDQPARSMDQLLRDGI